MKNIILFLIIILLSCNGQEENANDYFIYLKTCDNCSKQDQYKIPKTSNDQIYFDTAHCHLCGVQFNKPNETVNDPVILCDALTGNEYQYSREYSKWITVDSFAMNITVDSNTWLCLDYPAKFDTITSSHFWEYDLLDTISYNPETHVLSYRDCKGRTTWTKGSYHSDYNLAKPSFTLQNSNGNIKLGKPKDNSLTLEGSPINPSKIAKGFGASIQFKGEMKKDTIKRDLVGKYYDIIIDVSKNGYTAYKVPDSAWVVNNYNDLLILSMQYYKQQFPDTMNHDMNCLIEMCKEYLSNRK